MVDPLFGLAFRAADLDIDKADDKILAALKPRGAVRWIFARYRNRSTGCEFSIVAGLVPVERDTIPPSLGEPEPEFGVVVRECGGRYLALGVPSRLFEDLGVSKHIADGLADDAVRRLIRIFGGKESLRRQLTEQWRGTSGWGKPLNDALNRAGV